MFKKFTGNDDIRIVDLYMAAISGSVIYSNDEKRWPIHPHCLIYPLLTSPLNKIILQTDIFFRNYSLKGIHHWKKDKIA